MHRYDAAVIGGGPSGSTMATLLSSNGMHVALVERKTLRCGTYNAAKPCGGGLDARFWAYLPPGLNPDATRSAIVQHVINEIVVRYSGKYEAHHKSDNPIMHMGMRDRIDGYLAEHAARAADLMDGQALKSVMPVNGHYRVKTSKDDFLADMIVGADGAHSHVAKDLGITPQRKVFLASEWECDTNADQWSNWAGRSLIDVGNPRRLGAAYSWIFPKASPHLSIGWGIPHRLGRRLNALTQKILIDNHITGPVRRTAAWIPMYERGPLAQGRALLIGDAAGLCNPANGAGISYGMWSAWLAAEAIATGHPAPVYQALAQRILREYRWGRAMRNYMILMIALRRGAATRDPDLIGMFINDLQGKTTYGQWAREHRTQAATGLLIEPIVEKAMVRDHRKGW